MRKTDAFTSHGINLFRHVLLMLLLLTAGTNCLAQGNRATLKEPRGVAIDRGGRLFIADTANHRVLRVDSTGEVLIIAGTGAPTFRGDGQVSAGAGLHSPQGLAIDEAGNLFIADSGNHRIRRVDAKSNIISSVAGTGQAGYGGDGGPAINAQLNEPRSVALDRTGNLYIADTNNHRVRRVDVQTGVISTVAGSGQEGGLNDSNFGDLMKFAFGSPLGDGGKATGAILNHPTDVELDAAGNLYIADRRHSRVRRVDARSKRIKTLIATGNYVASLGETGSKGRASGSPLALAVDGRGNVYIASSSNQVQRFDAKSKKVTVVAGDSNGVKGDGGDDGEPARALFNSPGALVFDTKGNLVVADTGNHRIRYLDLGGNLTRTLFGK